MGSLHKKRNAKKSSTEDKKSDSPKEYAKGILDYFLINSRIPSTSGSVNPPVLESYVETFPDLVKHSANVSKTKGKKSKSNVAHTQLQNTSTEVSTEDAEKSENNEEYHTIPRKKGIKNDKKKSDAAHKKTMNTSTEVSTEDEEKTESSEENQTVSQKKGTKNGKKESAVSHRKSQNSTKVNTKNDKKPENSEKNQTIPRKKETKNDKKTSDIAYKKSQNTSTEVSTEDDEKEENSEENQAIHRKKGTKVKNIINSDVAHTKSQAISIEVITEDDEKTESSKENQIVSSKKGTKVSKTKTDTPNGYAKGILDYFTNYQSDETTEDVEKSESSNENQTVPKQKETKTRKTRSLPTHRVTRSTSIFQKLASSKQETKDFFGSLNWYDSKKSYYDDRLQIVLDDFALSESSDTDRGKQYYDYLLLDSRVSELTEWPGFVRAVFYAGKGKNKRALDHTKEAAKIWASDDKTTSKKVSRILDIWRGEGEVIVLTAADGLVEHEALTREALVIEALGKQRLCNKNYGSFYGVAATLKAREKHELGATLLVKARERFIEDGAQRVAAPRKLKKEFELWDVPETTYQELNDVVVLTVNKTQSKGTDQITI